MILIRSEAAREVLERARRRAATGKKHLEARSRESAAEIERAEKEARRIESEAHAARGIDSRDLCC